MLVMGMQLGIQRDEEKRRKKEIVLGYLTDHLKVSAVRFSVKRKNYETFKTLLFEAHSRSIKSSNHQANLNVNCTRLWCTICIYSTTNMLEWSCVFLFSRRECVSTMTGLQIKRIACLLFKMKPCTQMPTEKGKKICFEIYTIYFLWLMYLIELRMHDYSMLQAIAECSCRFTRVENQKERIEKDVCLHHKSILTNSLN